MFIRGYQSDDLDAISAINEAAVPAVSSVSRDTMARLVNESLIVLVAVDDDGTVGGFCNVFDPGAEYDSQNYAWFAERYPDFIYLDRIAIVPAFQRRGLGHKMYAEVEKLAARLRPSATSFTLEVNLKPRNDQSLAFHAQLGFTEVGVRSPSDDYSVSMMVKPLVGA